MFSAQKIFDLAPCDWVILFVIFELHHQFLQIFDFVEPIGVRGSAAEKDVYPNNETNYGYRIGDLKRRHTLIMRQIMGAGLEI